MTDNSIPQNGHISEDEQLKLCIALQHGLSKEIASQISKISRQLLTLLQKTDMSLDLARSDAYMGIINKLGTDDEIDDAGDVEGRLMTYKNVIFHALQNLLNKDLL